MYVLCLQPFFSGLHLSLFLPHSINMLRPTTHAKNANQHSGNIILEGKQKKCTPEEKQADDARAEQQRQEQAAERERGIKCLANIMDQVEKDK